MKTTLKRRNRAPAQIPEKKSAENAAGETVEKLENPSEKACGKTSGKPVKNAARKALVLEFLRYAAVGGIAFIADFGTFSLFRELVFRGGRDSATIVLSTAAGFVVGIAVNYVLSMLIVFTTAKQQEQGRNVRAVLIFAVVGLTGLFLTTGLQYLGEKLLLPTAAGQVFERVKEGLGKYAIKAVVTAIVLVWNYAGRKIFVFREK